MALIKKLNGKTPSFGENTYLAENATVIGDVTMGKNCSIWFQAIIRGDVHYIKTGDNVNVQDGAVLHCTYQKAPLNIGHNVSIGHRAIVHGCTVDENALIGMGAIVMDHAHIGKNAVIAAGAVVLENTVVPPNCIFAGVPAKKVKEADEEAIEGLNTRIAQHYIKYSGWYKNETGNTGQ